ncbi:copper homeostasis membrane protein CopD [Cupriavidus taiwanensis]|uniref:Copper resistance protein D n=1 Tax=Cupriavidus taiwanensis TaxID=164546 RepID=A0A7Z7NP52_9BURK|nr:copper homeostasis membrane protein CopD [Cupriavidus taiwanensis]SOZ08703.1 Copper resistance protein D [Cupriavidus taiwanensis]SOZ11040.1 Copper resistance protein D [Cupriavidus taiwanensis]SOZ42366.1 Copper resistance protein D [Cupriavidus taiwanensis]SPC21402.1 Copper resistance protein D [Cupriavidus taiwanensis]SPD55543.1 Copper resistance protein D [Cupriavidus taiwanensis]
MAQPEWLAAGLRLALYLDLALVFGLPLFCVYALQRDERAGRFARRCRALALGGAGVGIALSLLALVEMARAMTGASDYAALQAHVLAMIVTGTDFGVAWCVRMAALLLFALAGMGARRLHAPFAVLAAYGGVALATLAWGGHGAMHDGAVRYLHLASDVTHLLAAGAWMGALAAFLLLAWPGPTPHGEALALLSRSANGFARIGTRIVALLVVTGVLNYWLIVGPVMPEFAPMSYGGLLAAKLALFATMLGLAAANRFALAPRLEEAARTRERGPALRAVKGLRRSLLLEAGAAALVLALVAVLGMLSPTPA